MQILRKVEFGGEELLGEILLVHGDGVVLFLNVVYSAQCEGSSFPFSPLVEFLQLFLGCLPFGIVLLACYDEVINIDSANANKFGSFILEEHTLVKLVASPT